MIAANKKVTAANKKVNVANKKVIAANKKVIVANKKVNAANKKVNAANKKSKKGCVHFHGPRDSIGQQDISRAFSPLLLSPIHARRGRHVLCGLWCQIHR